MQTVDRNDSRLIDVPRGLANVVVTDTELGDVRGAEGFYHYRQYAGTDLARTRSVEDVWALLLDGRLPTGPDRAAFAREVSAAMALPAAVATLLPGVADLSRTADPLAGVRIALAAVGAARGTAPLYDLDRTARRADVLGLAATVPALVAALHRLRRGEAVVEPRADLGFVANYLWMLDGAEPDARRVDALSVYLVAAIDHGFNASTFTARLVASTGADAASCLVAALGSLSGPLHGGAPARALETLDAIGSRDRIDAWVTERLEAGDRIMGFGHPVYRTEDPRSALLKEVARSFGGPRVELAIAVEERVPELLDRYKPGRRLRTNIEWYAAVVMEQVGLDRALLTPTFAVARALGWAANVLEQTEDGKIIRPAARYVGPPAPEPVPAC